MKRRPRRHGVSILIAIGLLGMVAVSLAILTRQLGYETRRTRAGDQDAQLRQLLLAGGRATMQAMDAHEGKIDPEAVKVMLPLSLSDRHASVLIEAVAGTGDGRDVRVVARLENRQAIQMLHFHDEAGRWKFVAATLNP